LLVSIGMNLIRKDFAMLRIQSTRKSRFGLALTALLAGAAFGAVGLIPVAEAAQAYKLPPRAKARQQAGGLGSWGHFIARQPMEANPFRVDASSDHGPRRYSGSRLYVPTPDWDR
jgi:hypothetical protein